jgi:hypothetical protein
MAHSTRNYRTIYICLFISCIILVCNAFSIMHTTWVKSKSFLILKGLLRTVKR